MNKLNKNSDCLCKVDTEFKDLCIACKMNNEKLHTRDFEGKLRRLVNE